MVTHQTTRDRLRALHDEARHYTDVVRFHREARAQYDADLAERARLTQMPNPIEALDAGPALSRLYKDGLQPELVTPSLLAIETPEPATSLFGPRPVRYRMAADLIAKPTPVLLDEIAAFLTMRMLEVLGRAMSPQLLGRCDDAIRSFIAERVRALHQQQYYLPGHFHADFTSNAYLDEHGRWDAASARCTRVPDSVARSLADGLLSALGQEFQAGFPIEIESPPEPDDPPPPPVIVDAARRWTLPQPVLVEHFGVRARGELLVGRRVADSEPVCIPRSWIYQHFAAIGATGAAKTSSILIPLSEQIIRGSDDDSGCPPSLWVFDPKREAAIRETLREEAAQRGVPFICLSFEPQDDSDHILLWESIAFLANARSKAELLCNGLQLNFGLAQYGVSYHSSTNILGMANAIQCCQDDPLSFQRLAQVVQKTNGKKGETLDVANRLALIAMTDPEVIERLEAHHAAGAARTWTVDRALEERAVVYIGMDQDDETGIALGRLLFQALFATCRRREREGRQRKTVALLEECHLLVSKQIATAAATARGVGLGLGFFCQSADQLKMYRLDLTEAILGNVQIRIDFTVSSPEELSRLEALSGEELIADIRSFALASAKGHSSSVLNATAKTNTRNFATAVGCSITETISPTGLAVAVGSTAVDQVSHGVAETDQVAQGDVESEGETKTVAVTERPVSRLRRNDILQASSSTRHAVLQVKVDDGLFGGPVLIETLWSLPRSVYERRQSTPWPRRRSYRGCQQCASESPASATATGLTAARDEALEDALHSIYVNSDPLGFRS